MPGQIDKQIEPALRMRVTISDVSDALGMAKSTVSRALNGYTDISESTRLLVARTAEKMGYQPLSHAQAIRTGRSRSLGLVIQFSDHDAHRPFLAEFLAGISQGASAEGWTVTIATADSPAATLETFRSLIRNQKADGFILARTMVDDPRVTLLREADVPFVLFGRTSDPTGCAWHDVLGEDAMRDAVGYLASLGHSRIGFINGGTQYNYAPLRLDGFLAGMDAAGLRCRPEHLASGAVTPDSGEAACRKIMATDTPPTALVCALDMAALGVYRAATDLGLRVGSDLSVIGYDGIPEGAHMKPELTTFSVDHVASGRRLSDLLIRRIRGEAIETLRDTTAATLKDGGSAGSPARTSAQLAALIARNAI